MTNAFNGTSRTEYLNWVQNWKAEYKALSEEIRTAKANRKTKLWSYREAGDEYSPKRTAIGDNPNYSATASSVVFYGKERATEMLALRAEAKLIAQQQFEAAQRKAA